MASCLHVSGLNAKYCTGYVFRPTCIFVFLVVSFRIEVSGRSPATTSLALEAYTSLTQLMNKAGNSVIVEAERHGRVCHGKYCHSILCSVRQRHKLMQ